MNYSWNITSEVMRRECGFSDRWETRARNASSFNKSILGSYYIAQQITAVNIVGEKYTNPRSLNFNRKGDLLCVGYDDKQIAIYDWAHNKLKYCFYSKHTENPEDVKLLNTDDNVLDIISTSNDGQIRRAQISPTGKVTSTCLYQVLNARLNLTEVPRNAFEFVGVSTFGRIYLMDLRCSEPVCLSDTEVLGDTDRYLPLYDVAHHPYASEFCVGGCDPFLRIFDKRNLKKCIEKMCPKNLENEMTMEILQCSYNYNGSEIVANFVTEGVYLFNSRNSTHGHYLGGYSDAGGGYDEVEFFGPKSEFVICCENDGIHIFHKKSSKYASVKCDDLLPDTDDDSISYFSTLVFVCGVKPHPFLPVIASKTCKRGVIIWAPKNK